VVVAVQPLAPQLVEPRPADHERRVELEPVGPVRGRLEKLAHGLDVALPADARQVGHHVRDDLEAGVLGEREARAHGRHRVAAVGVARDVLVDALNAHLEARAAVGEHVAQVRREAVVGPRLDRQADAARPRVLAVRDGLGRAPGPPAPAQGVVEGAHEGVAVVGGEGHERAAHQDELDLVGRVAQAPQLLDARARLRIGVVPRADRAHARRLVARVRLRAVLKVRVGPSRAVDADGARRGEVRAAVRLAHDGDDGDARGGADGLGAEPGREARAVGVGQGREDLDELGRAAQAVARGRGGLERGEVDVAPADGALAHERGDDVGDGAQAALGLAGGVGAGARRAGGRRREERAGGGDGRRGAAHDWRGGGWRRLVCA